MRSQLLRPKWDCCELWAAHGDKAVYFDDDALYEVDLGEQSTEKVYDPGIGIDPVDLAFDGRLAVWVQLDWAGEWSCLNTTGTTWKIFVLDVPTRQLRVTHEGTSDLSQCDPHPLVALDDGFLAWDCRLF